MIKFVNNNWKIMIVSFCFISMSAMLFGVFNYSYAATEEATTIYTRDELSEKVRNNNLFLASHPIGSTYTSSINTSPQEIYGGAWAQTWADYERIQVGSQVLFDNMSGTENIPITKLIGSYNYVLLDRIFVLPINNGNYHKEYSVTAQASTRSDNFARIYINNIMSNSARTYSANAFRTNITTPYFKESDLVLEPVVNYETNPLQGVNIKYEVYGDVSGSWEIWNITLHGFLVSNDMVYKWTRTA